jgi:hypothetical protein
MTDERTTIPDAKNAPKEGELPRRFGKINNLCKDDELTKKLRGWLATELEHFRGQEERKEFCDAGGVMDYADRMERVAERRDTSSAQYRATLSNVASSAFRRATMAMVAGEYSVFFQGQELPAKYEPVFAGQEYNQTEGLMISEQRNMLEDYTWERDERRKKVKDVLYYNKKYGQYFVSMEWDYRKEKRIHRVRNENGSFSFKEKETVIADNPTMILHDPKNIYADAQIDGIQPQRTLLDERYVPYEQLGSEQANGWIQNLDKVGSAQIAERDYEEETLDARRKNSGSDQDQERTGLLKVWHAWCRVPIVEKERKGAVTGKGKWVDGGLPELYWATFVGELNDARSVCVRLIKNPYFHKRIPYEMVHAYRDDKGLYHVSPAELVYAQYWQLVTNWNQAHDNVTKRTSAPMVADGPVKTRDLTYKQNKLIRIGRGVRFEPVPIERTTELTMEMVQKLEDDIFATLGTNKPIMGLPLLGRTSASEATNALEQARVPLLEQADDVGMDLFSWMLQMDAMLWEQYGDPELVLTLTKSNMLQEFKPAELFGPFKVAVTAITQFESATEKRRGFNAFLQNGYQLAMPSMGKQGEMAMWRAAWPEFMSFGDVNAIFPPQGDFDATRVAINESDGMLNQGIFDEPMPEENHRAHLAVHEQAQNEYKYLPDADKNPEWERMHLGHIEKHRGYEQAGPPIDVQAEGEQQGLPGELAANPIEAEAGAQAQLG